MKVMTVIFTILAVLAGSCLVGLFATPVLAQVPPLPHAFYGTVKINDSPAPIGTEVEAEVEGVVTGVQGNPIVTTEAGKYGGPGGLDPKLVVQGDIEDGATITFYVNGVVADQTAEWHSGEVTKLDLTVIITVVPPEVATDPATDITSTAATLKGSLIDLGDASSVQVSFQWGLTTAYGSQTSPQTMTSTGSFGATLTGLSANTTYHFRAKAVGQGTSFGIDRTLTTRTSAGGGGGGGGAARDTTPPRISNVSLCPVDVAETTADICWTTDEKSTSQVEYWTSPSMLSPIDETYVIEHHVQLTGLTPGTTYHYKTMSKDKAGNLAVSDVYTFTTKGKAPAAAFTSCCLRISPSEVNIGEEVTISVSVNNTGNATGSCEVTLKINGVVEAAMKVTLDAGASEEVTFTTAKDVAGTYSVAVDGVSGSFTVKEKPTLPPPPPEKEAPPAKPLNWPLIGGIIAAVVIVGLLIFFLARRRAA
jgi:hypothetical protein